MNRRVLHGILIMALGTMGTTVWPAEKAAPMKMVPFHYTQGFEEGPNPFQYWVTNPAKYTINYNDVTGEKAASGKESYKLDITFLEGCYSYWSIPLRVPAEGKLNFRGKILLASGDGVRAGLGINASFPKSWLSGCSAFTQFDESKDWQTVSADISDLVRAWSGGWSGPIRGMTREHIGTYMDLIGLFLYVSKPTRAVIYVDDLEITGEAPEGKAYEEEVARRWSVYQTQVLNPALTNFSTRLADVERTLGDQAGLDEKVRAGVVEKMERVKKNLETVKKKGWMSSDEYAAMDKALTDSYDRLKGARIGDLFK